MAKKTKKLAVRSSRQLREAIARAERAEAEVARLKAEIKEIKFEFHWESGTLGDEIARLKKVIYKFQEEKSFAEWEVRNEIEIEELKHKPGRRPEVPHAVIAALESKFTFDEIMNKETAELVAAIERDLPMSRKTVQRHIPKARQELSVRRLIENMRANSKTS